MRDLQDELFLGLISLPSGHNWGNRRDLAEWVKTLGGWRRISKFVDDRFAAKNSAWGKDSERIAAADATVKDEMRVVWQSHRRASHLYVNGSSFAVEMPDWGFSPAWVALRTLMSSFYDAALGDSVFPLPANRKINREIYLDGFSSLSVCPYWDCHLTRSEAQLDHFFPISSFPFLSVCPDNLVPVSSGPNRRGHKGNKLALDLPVGSQAKRAATTWLHPMWLDAVGKLEAVVSRKATKPLVVTTRSTNPQWKTHVSNYDDLVDLSSYWTEEVNARWRTDLSAMASEVSRYGPTPTTVVTGRLDDLAMPDPNRPFGLLSKARLTFCLGDSAALAEIGEQAAELKRQFRNN